MRGCSKIKKNEELRMKNYFGIKILHSAPKEPSFILHLKKLADGRNQIAVAIRVVHTGYIDPEFGVMQPVQRTGGFAS